MLTGWSNMWWAGHWLGNGFWQKCFSLTTSSSSINSTHSPFWLIYTSFSHLVNRALLSPYLWATSLHFIILDLLNNFVPPIPLPRLSPAFNLPVWWGRRPQTHDGVSTPWCRSSKAIKEKTFLGMKPPSGEKQKKYGNHLIMCYLPLLQQTVSWRHLLVHSGHYGDPLKFKWMTLDR